MQILKKVLKISATLKFEFNICQVSKTFSYFSPYISYRNEETVTYNFQNITQNDILI